MKEKKLNIHYFQHEKYEKLFAIEDWIKGKGHNLSRTFFKAGEPLPEIENIDGLIIMGGSMSANDEIKFPWLVEEKKFIEKSINNNKIVVGICLGAQLIANALGAKVFKNLYKEIGWFPISFTEEARKVNPFDDNTENMTVFHWHSETFELPDRAVLIASSEACKNQIFNYSKNVIGLQCHLEQTESSLKDMVKYGKSELDKDRFVQTESEILEGLKYIRNNQMLLNKILSKFSEYSSDK